MPGKTMDHAFVPNGTPEGYDIYQYIDWNPEGIGSPIFEGDGRVSESLENGSIGPPQSSNISPSPETLAQAEFSFTQGIPAVTEVSWSDYCDAVHAQRQGGLCLRIDGEICPGGGQSKCPVTHLVSGTHRWIGHHYTSRELSRGFVLVSDSQDVIDVDDPSWQWSLYRVEPQSGQRRNLKRLFATLQGTELNEIRRFPLVLQLIARTDVTDQDHPEIGLKGSLIRCRAEQGNKYSSPCPFHEVIHSGAGSDSRSTKFRFQARRRTAAGQGAQEDFMWILRGCLPVSGAGQDGNLAIRDMWSHCFTPNQERVRRVKKAGPSSGPNVSSDHSSTTSESNDKKSFDDRTTRHSKRTRSDEDERRALEDAVARTFTRHLTREEFRQHEFLVAIVSRLAKYYKRPENLPITLSILPYRARGPHVDVGRNALNSIASYNETAKRLGWHANPAIQALFDRLSARVQYHRQELILTSESGGFVPYIGDIAFNTVVVNEETNDIIRLSDSIADRRPESLRDQNHVLARLSFLTHLLTRVNLGRELDGPGVGIFPRSRRDQSKAARLRIKEDVLETYYRQRADRYPTEEETVRFWRFVDIEHCDYIAYYAGIEKNGKSDFNAHFTQAWYQLRTLMYNEAFFENDLRLPLPTGVSVKDWKYRLSFPHRQR